jgi:hypothetical protein
MSWFQKAVLALVPRQTAEKMEEESRDWVLTCTCGHDTSLWDMGGIRYGGRGKSWTMTRCGGCGRTFWGSLHKRSRFQA